MTPNIPLENAGEFITLGAVQFFHTTKDAKNFVDWITSQGLIQADPSTYRTKDYIRWNELDRPNGEYKLF